jgi:Holliday junction resolvasome RuvABC endonuclease subunit
VGTFQSADRPDAFSIQSPGPDQIINAAASMTASPLQNVLALDIATITGWARGDVGAVPACGSVRFSTKGASQVAICGRALEWAIEVLRDPLPDVVVIEDLLPPGALKQRSNEHHELLAHLHGVIMGVCFVRGIYQVHKHSLASIRSHFIGGTIFAKGEVKFVVQRKCRSLGWLESADDDAADACALWSYACSLIDPEQAIRVSPLFARIATATN